MDGFNIGKIILGLQNHEFFIKKLKQKNFDKLNSFAPEINSSLSNTKPQNNQLLQNLQAMSNATKLLQMNTLASMDRAIFVKNLCFY